MARDYLRAPGSRGPGLLQRLFTRLLSLLIAFIAGALAMHIGMHADDKAHMQAQQSQIESLGQQLAQAQADLAQASAANEAQGGMQAQQREQLQTMQEELAQARGDLAFYEQLIPAGSGSAPSVRAFDVQRTAHGALRYRLLLTRNAAPEDGEFAGTLRFVTSDGAPLPLLGATGLAAAPQTELAVRLGQMLRLDGLLELPQQATTELFLELVQDGVVRARASAPVPNP